MLLGPSKKKDEYEETHIRVYLIFSCEFGDYRVHKCRMHYIGTELS